jgi:hypothetical protein
MNLFEQLSAFFVRDALEEGRADPSLVQVSIDDSVIAGAKRHSLLLLVIFRDGVSTKIGHYGGPPIFACYSVDELCRLFAIVDGAFLQSFKEHIRW